MSVLQVPLQAAQAAASKARAWLASAKIENPTITAPSLIFIIPPVRRSALGKSGAGRLKIALTRYEFPTEEEGTEGGNGETSCISR